MIGIVVRKRKSFGLGWAAELPCITKKGCLEINEPKQCMIFMHLSPPPPPPNRHPTPHPSAVSDPDRNATPISKLQLPHRDAHRPGSRQPWRRPGPSSKNPPTKPHTTTAASGGAAQGRSCHVRVHRPPSG